MGLEIVGARGLAGGDGFASSRLRARVGTGYFARRCIVVLSLLISLKLCAQVLATASDDQEHKVKL
jgi:hypothetical protein